MSKGVIDPGDLTRRIPCRVPACPCEAAPARPHPPSRVIRMQLCAAHQQMGDDDLATALKVTVGMVAPLERIAFNRIEYAR